MKMNSADWNASIDSSYDKVEEPRRVFVTVAPLVPPKITKVKAKLPKGIKWN
jgi:hypothetical protein